jgi:hypothetical protein
MAAIDLQTNSLLKEAFRFFTHEEVSFIQEPPGIVVGPLTE